MTLPNLKNIDKFTLAIIGSLAAVGVIVIYLGTVLLKDKISLPKISLGPRVTQRAVSDVLFLTSPVYSFTGKVDRISGDTIWISQNVTLSQPLAVAAIAPGLSPTPTPTSISKTITFRVKVPENTSITKTTNPIPYLFKTTNGTALPGLGSTLTLDQVKEGENISFTSTTDLRSTDPNQIVAGNVTVNPTANSISGQVTAISGNILTIKALIPQQPFAAPIAVIIAPEERDYAVTIGSDTEISQIIPSADPFKPGNKKRLSLSDMKVGDTVTSYTDVDAATNFQFTALLVQPTLIIPAVIPQSPTPITP